MLLDDEVPAELPWLLRLLPRADLYLQDEVKLALHPIADAGVVPEGTPRPPPSRPRKNPTSADVASSGRVSLADIGRAIYE